MSSSFDFNLPDIPICQNEIEGVCCEFTSSRPLARVEWVGGRGQGGGGVAWRGLASRGRRGRRKGGSLRLLVHDIVDASLYAKKKSIIPIVVFIMLFAF